MSKSIYSFIRTQVSDYKTKTVPLASGLDFNQFQTLNRTELYSNSTYETGNTDSKGRDKPFFNINKAPVLVETRATDVDTKDFSIISDSRKHYVQSWLYSVENRIWMRESKFDRFLNTFGRTLVKYGGALAKKIEHKGELKIVTVPWSNLITDQTDIMHGVVIERHNWSPSKLKKMEGVWSNIDEAIATATQKKVDTNGEEAEIPGNTVEIFEVHGDLPESMYMENGREDVYFGQVHIIAGVFNYSVSDYDQVIEGGVVLYKNKEDVKPYKYLARDPVPGRALGVGVVEDLFEAQRWTNDAVIEEKRVMEIAGKVIFQTSDKTVDIDNLAHDLDHGDLLKYKTDPIRQVNLIPSAVPQYNGIIDKWNAQATKVTSTPESVTGETLPSGTPYRLGLLQNQSGTSIFQYRLEEKGVFLKEMWMDWVFPHLTKKLKKAHTLTTDFDLADLQKIDDAFINFNVNKQIIENLRKGKATSAAEAAELEQFLSSTIKQTKNRRFIEIPEGFYDNVKYRLDVLITDESLNKAVYLESLNSLLQLMASNPAIAQDPKLTKIANSIMEVSGFSPVEMAEINATPAAGLPGIQGNEVSVKETQQGELPGFRQ